MCVYFKPKALCIYDITYNIYKYFNPLTPNDP